MKTITIVSFLVLVILSGCRTKVIVVTDPIIPQPEQSCNEKIEVGVLLDIDGNPYYIAQIGSKKYVFEYLKTKTLNNGEPLQYIIDSAEWAVNEDPAYCFYENREDAMSIGYSTVNVLYNWAAVETGKLCPEGWHVMTDEESTELQYLLKVGNFVNVPCIPVSYIPSTTIVGHRNNLGEFGSDIMSWTSTSFDDENAYSRKYTWGLSDFVRIKSNKKYGLTCRCIKDY